MTLITWLFPNNYQITTLINLNNTSIAAFPGSLQLRFLERMQDFESCMWSKKLSGRQPSNEAVGTRIIHSESEEAPATSASMLGTPMQANK